MNILVTGGCGFIGSNFVNYICKKYKNYKIINLDNLYYCASIDNIDTEVKSSNNYKFIKGNINDFNLVKYILKEAEKSGKDLSQNQSEIVLKNLNFISQCHRNISNKWNKNIPSHDEICGWDFNQLRKFLGCSKELKDQVKSVMQAGITVSKR